MRRFTAVFAFLGLVLVPAAAFAQATITGVVRDGSGAVLPGVLVIGAKAGDLFWRQSSIALTHAVWHWSIPTRVSLIVRMRFR